MTSTVSCRVSSHGDTILAYSIIDLVAEKYRALIQQKLRNRTRPQDVHDIAHILRGNSFDSSAQKAMYLSLLAKARSRHIEPKRNALHDRETIERARREYATLKLEVPETTLDFARDYSAIREFYENLPWENE